MVTRRTRRALGAAAGLAGVAGAAATWELTRRRNRRELLADPERDILTAPLPGFGRTVVSADGTRLAVWEAGPPDGPVVVFAHGWGMAVRFWIHQLRELSADHRVIAYDQRGHAASGKAADGDYSADALGADLEAVLATCVPAGRRALLVGHSMGAMSIVAWAHAADGPVEDRVHGAILADTGVDQLYSTFFAELGVAKLVADTIGVRAMSSRLPLPPGSSPVGHRATAFIACGRDASPSAVTLTEQLFLETPADVRSAIGMTMSSLDLAHGVARLTVPTTVVIGTADRLTPPVHSQRLADALPDADLVELTGAGHQAPLERHHDFTKLVRQHTVGAEVAGPA
ncbi:alpha/beta fold hydrolase [Egicoccus halophilus]|uniref:Hydrolase n=1 Tax=Egicoccus halophilus TaxID=1670830 RepID=A0A8J3EQP4_9ACTN|nr:alpha/beta fold hydrolase [Egicoccus halophilus]GGI02865.1 hydrolase [Egicoccus halophilus]